ncbi:MAG: serine hydrolase domain-containing protein [Nitrospiria bacterium]
MNDRITGKMNEGLSSAVFPGAVLLIAHHGSIRFHKAFGFAEIRPKRIETRLDTLFDLASLTKPLATAAACAELLKRHVLKLENPVANYLPGFNTDGKREITLFHLLNHSAGLPDWKPYNKDIAQRETREHGFLGSPEAKAAVYRMAQQEPLIAAPGEKSLYSDIGFILLGAVIEHATGLSLDQFCDETLFSRFETDTAFFIPTNNPDPNLFDRTIAATEDLPWRKGIVRGIVHDDNAYAMGGVAGHAGLFSTATGVYRLVRAWLDSLEGSGPLDRETARRFVTRQEGEHAPKKSSWGLGWDTPSRPKQPGNESRSSAGRYFSLASFGHLGYTGTSIWVDRQEDLVVILLTNRVHPSHENKQIQSFRPALHDIIFEAFVGG